MQPKAHPSYASKILSAAQFCRNGSIQILPVIIAVGVHESNENMNFIHFSLQFVVFHWYVSGRMSSPRLLPTSDKA